MKRWANEQDKKDVVFSDDEAKAAVKSKREPDSTTPWYVIRIPPILPASTH